MFYPITLCQFNPQIGAVSHNVDRMLLLACQAHNLKAGLLVFPELAICGYPIKDLIFLSDLIDACEAGLVRLARETPVPVIVGAPTRERYNAAYFCFSGEYKIIAKKRLLPNYQVFDEQRYFRAGTSEDLNYFDFKGQRLGICICEDAWSLELGYLEDPVGDLVQKHQVDILVNLSASPFELDKPQKREKMFCELARHYQKPFLVAGQVGANDGLIFDGGSLVIDSQGTVFSRVKSFEEGFCSNVD